jgi:hypothetical protein
MTPEGGWVEGSKEAEEESEEMLDAQQEDLKRKLRANYASMLHAVIATRAVLLQAIPMLSILSIFASTMSTTPIMVHSKRLRANLPELIISSPFAEARAQEQELIDEQEWIRKANLTEDLNCVPNPKMKFHKGHMVKVPAEFRHEVSAGNKYNRDRMRKIIEMPSRTVDEWIVAINGSVLYATESRGINFVLNLYKFSLTVAMLYINTQNLKYLMISAALVLLPYCSLMAMSVVVLLGKMLYVTDDDLERALSQVGFTFLFRWMLRYTGSKKRAKADVLAEQTNSPDLEAWSESEGVNNCNDSGSGGNGGEGNFDDDSSLDDEYHHEQQGWQDGGLGDDDDDAAAAATDDDDGDGDLEQQVWQDRGVDSNEDGVDLEHQGWQDRGRDEEKELNTHLTDAVQNKAETSKEDEVNQSDFDISDMGYGHATGDSPGMKANPLFQEQPPSR